MNFIWIDNDALLAQASVIWQAQSVLAIDTEFMRTHTFFAKLGLIQIATSEAIWLIDPLNISQWAPLTEVLSQGSICKVFHSVSEDADILFHLLGVALTNVFDTQIAESFLSDQLQISYAQLVHKYFQIELPKSVTRSNWLQRPLSTEQLVYAAQDVFWLFRLYLRLSDILRQNNRYDWVVEDSTFRADATHFNTIDHYYLKLRGAWKLQTRRLLALKNISVWREHEVRKLNITRNRFINDKALIAIAEMMPSQQQKVFLSRYLSSSYVRKYGPVLIDMVDAAKKAPPETQWPDPIIGPLPVDHVELLTQVQTYLKTVSQKLNIPLNVLVRRKQLEYWLSAALRNNQHQVPAFFLGWRKPLVVDTIENMIRLA